MQKIKPVGCFNLCYWRFVYIYIYFLLFEENHQKRISRAGEKINQGNFHYVRYLAQLFINTSAVILGKNSEIVGEIFLSSENAIWSILLKYQ